MTYITAKVDSDTWSIKAGNKYKCQISPGGLLLSYIGENSVHEIISVTAAKVLFDEKDLFTLLLISN